MRITLKSGAVVTLDAAETIAIATRAKQGDAVDTSVVDPEANGVEYDRAWMFARRGSLMVHNGIADEIIDVTS